jgi:hypothetical protein
VLILVSAFGEVKRKRAGSKKVYSSIKIGAVPARRRAGNTGSRRGLYIERQAHGFAARRAVPSVFIFLGKKGFFGWKAEGVFFAKSPADAEKTPSSLDTENEAP